MGSGGSKKSKPPPPKTVPGVPPQPPYLGKPCEYRFENYMIPYVVQSDFGFMPTQGMALTTLDVNVYNVALGSLYDLGYRLLTFSVVPASLTVSGFVTANVKQTHKYQGICRKLPDDELPQQWSLKVLKSVLPSTVFTYGLFRLGDSKATADTNHIFQTIVNEASNGARLVCVEITGFNSQNVSQPGATSAAAGAFGGNAAMNICFFGQSPQMILGVDIFMEIPRNPTPTRYVYQCVTIPMKITWLMAMAMGGKWQVEMDWVGVTSQYLGSGWRLVDTFMDQNNSAFRDNAFFTSKITISQNCIFIFEKEQSKLNDNTPQYEATMVEYNAPGKMTGGIGTTTASTNPAWEPILAHLGTFGWELVKILDTPAMKFDGIAGFGSLTFKKVMWMFLQRKIVTSPPPTEEKSPPAPVVATS